MAENVWLACGHERGHVVLWDALTGRRYDEPAMCSGSHSLTTNRFEVASLQNSVKTLEGIHETAIVSLRFLNDKGHLITADLTVRQHAWQSEVFLLG